MARDRSRPSVFPRRYITDMFAFLKERDEVEFLTYADLPWSEDQDWENRYPEEEKAWRQALRKKVFDRSKVYVLIQYDVDSSAERTMDLLRHPEHRDVPANIMIFNRRVHKPSVVGPGPVEFTPYAVDHDLLDECRERGSVVGYHTNAVEQAKFDLDLARDIFWRDVDELSERHEIRFFSPHGGSAGPNGERNHSLQLPADQRRNLRWVHNRHTVKFKAGYTDGGHNGKRVPPAERDLRDFVATFRRGRRYRILLHPQYYGTSPVASESYGGTPWYDDVLAATNGTESLWAEASLAGRGPFAWLS